MTELVICSGKGGTGKTSVLASFAALGQNLVLADCDVDAANLHLVLEPGNSTTTSFTAGHGAVIRPEDCESCGECQRLCRFSAIAMEAGPAGAVSYRVDPIACEGCGVCVRFCPAGAIDFPEQHCGQWSVSSTRFGPLVHARLAVGAENSGKLVSLVRQQARQVARESGRDFILIDGPPGIGCPVSAALTGADCTLIVTEPSLSGLHDLQRILDLADHFAIPAMVCINKFDLSLRLSGCIKDYCKNRGIPVVGMIPHEPLVSEAQIAGLSLVEFVPDCQAARAMTKIWGQTGPALAEAVQKKG